MQFVRILEGQQRQEMLELLAEGFPQSKIDWRAAFDAPLGDTGHGMLLTVDGRAQGGLLTFEKMETIGGRQRRIVNLSSWYMRPPYRKLAVRMARAASADPDTIYTTCTAIRSVQKICLRVGFRYLSHGSIASIPLINGAFFRPASRIEPLVVEALPNRDHDRWIADHAGERHVGILVRTAASAVPVLWLRGLKLRGLSAARLLFTADYGALRAALPAVHWYMLRRHGIAGLYLPRIGPLADLRSVRRRHSGPSLMVKGDVDAEDVNLLYTELLHLHPREQS
jgi:hypothetical protein